jgi:hypothetical protein
MSTTSTSSTYDIVSCEYRKFNCSGQEKVCYIGMSFLAVVELPVDFLDYSILSTVRVDGTNILESEIYGVVKLLCECAAEAIK